jgi:hypothetical protein
VVLPEQLDPAIVSSTKAMMTWNKRPTTEFAPQTLQDQEYSTAAIRLSAAYIPATESSRRCKGFGTRRRSWTRSSVRRPRLGSLYVDATRLRIGAARRQRQVFGQFQYPTVPFSSTTNLFTPTAPSSANVATADPKPNTANPPPPNGRNSSSTSNYAKWSSAPAAAPTGRHATTSTLASGAPCSASIQGSAHV